MKMIARCKKCDWTSRYDIPEHVARYGLNTGNGEFAELFKILAFHHCAHTMRDWAFCYRFSLIDGHKTAGRCDSKCWNSVAAKCKCSCGGEMHASAYSDNALLQIGQMA